MAYAIPMIREKAVARVIEIPIELIAPNPNQPRKHFDNTALGELALSIRQHGIIQPLTVRRCSTGYELVAGERRLRAAQKAGLSVVPCVLQEISEQSSAVCALIENLQRRDLDYFEEAEGIAKLISIYGLTQEQTAVKLSKNQSTIANKLRLLKYSEYERCKMLEASLTERHARALLKIEDLSLRSSILDTVIKNSLNVSQTEQLIEETLCKEEEKKNPPDTKKHNKLIPKDLRLFFNSINHAIKSMQQAGIKVVTEQKRTDGFIELTIRIPESQN